MTAVTRHLAARRRMIRRQGAICTLRRQTAVSPAPTYTSVSVYAFSRESAPDDIRDGLRQANRIAEILADEIVAAAWPAPPRNGDSLVTPFGTLAVLACVPVWAAATVIGYRLYCRAAA